MYELTYQSEAKKKVTQKDIKEILESARRHNKINGVTGCLIYYNRRFIQIIEGSKAAVQETYQRICEDRRHKEIQLIAENSTAERTFPEWGMAYFPIDEGKINTNELKQFRNNINLLAGFSRPSKVSGIMFWVKVKALLAEPPGFYDK